MVSKKERIDWDILYTPTLSSKLNDLFFFCVCLVAKYDFGHNSRPQSVQSRDACSQTESVDDELFLKDVIIR